MWNYEKRLQYPVTVSYTHLDVYKRQDISNPDHQNCKSQYRDHKGAYQLFLDWFIYFFPKWIFSLSYHAVLPA